MFLFSQYGGNAASLNVAEQYVSAFSNLAKSGNTILLPSNTGDISSMVGQVSTTQVNYSKPLMMMVERVELTTDHGFKN